MSAPTGRLAGLVAGAAFQRGTLALILANAALMGLETCGPVVARWGGALGLAETALQALFVAEIALRVAACAPRPLRFFRDGWNTFDSVVVAASLLPALGAFATVARLARVLRIARLVPALPELRLIVGTMLRSIPSMGHVVALLGLLLYVYGIFGYHLFADDAPQHWGSLPAALQSLFQILTLEGWVELQAEVLATHPWAWTYFASFIVIAVFVVINLFIAVVINNLETTRREDRARTDARTDGELLGAIAALRDRLDSLERLLRRNAA